MAESETSLVTRSQSLVLREELGVEDVIAQVHKIQDVMAKVMKPGEHYGVIPGTQKPTLLKPGAEKLLLTFRLDPQYESTETYDGPHLTVKSKCTLWHITSGLRIGSGEGSCSTKESKYAYRKGARLCPKCSKDTIIKGKAEYGGGWLCFGKKGGCGEKWKDGDAAIESQNIERIANEDLADQYNTILKMANKRSLVAAVLNATAASDIFTQDLEDMPGVGRSNEGRSPEQEQVSSAPREQALPVGVPSGVPDVTPVATISEPQANRFYAIARGSGWTDDQIHDLLAGHKLNATKEIPVASYDKIVDTLKAGPRK